MENIVNILKAEKNDLSKILELQKIAYLSEAEIHNDYSIQPLNQSIEELEREYENNIILKLINNNIIIGSIRAFEENNCVFIGKLIVHPEYQNKGYGTKLLLEIEKYFKCKIFKLFTSSKSNKNLYIYKKMVIKKLNKKKD